MELKRNIWKWRKIAEKSSSNSSQQSPKLSDGLFRIETKDHNGNWIPMKGYRSLTCSQAYDIIKRILRQNPDYKNIRVRPEL